MMTPASRTSAGFSLIELLVSVAIVATLAAIAIPLYDRQTQSTYRGEAQGDLLACAQGLERLASQEWSYAGGVDGGGIDATVCSPLSEEGGRYTFTLVADVNSYTITATPQGVMDEDGIMTVDEAGNRGWDRNGNDAIEDDELTWDPD